MPSSDPNPPPAAPPPPVPARRHAGDPLVQLPVARSPVHLDDLLDGLLWPKLLRAPALALGPGRLGFASALVVVIFTLDTVWRAIFGGPAPGPLVNTVQGLRKPAGELLTALLPYSQGGSWTWNPDLAEAGRATMSLFIHVPTSLVLPTDAQLGGQAGGQLVPGILATLLLLPLGALLLAICGGAISRSVACEFALGQVISWPKALGFALGRWGSLLGALLGPVVVVWGLCVVLLAVGWLMKWPVLNFAIALLFPLALVLALLAAVVMAAYVLGHIMLIPAVACDGADGFDAIQRAYAYVYGRPLRLVGYLLIVLVQGVLAFLLLGGFAYLTLMVAQQTTGVAVATEARPAATAAWFDRATAWTVQFWGSLVKVVVFSYAISLYYTGSTLIYLLMRRLNDEQDIRDIWQPASGGVLAVVDTRPIASPAGPMPAAAPIPEPPPAPEPRADGGVHA